MSPWCRSTDRPTLTELVPAATIAQRWRSSNWASKSPPDECRWIPSDQALALDKVATPVHAALDAQGIGLVDRRRHPSGVRGGIHEADRRPRVIQLR